MSHWHQLHFLIGIQHGVNTFRSYSADKFQRCLTRGFQGSDKCRTSFAYKGQDYRSSFSFAQPWKDKNMWDIFGFSKLHGPTSTSLSQKHFLSIALGSHLTLVFNPSPQIKHTHLSFSTQSDTVSYPLEVQTWVGWDSTCDSLYHSRHRTEADPGGNRRQQHFILLPNQLGSSENNMSVGKLTSFSDVPHMLQHLHSMHCQRYVFTAAIITGVNCRQDGCPAEETLIIFSLTEEFPSGLSIYLSIYQSIYLLYLCIPPQRPHSNNIPERPQSEQDTSSSDWPVLWLVLESPRQKSQ